MPKKERYDLIVVGAGPGGSACAKIAADKGLDVLMIERAEVPGQKNMSGAVLFTPICTEIFPNFMSAPFMQKATTLANVGVCYTVDNDEHEVLVGFSPGSDVMTGMPVISRPETDAWMAEQAVLAGAEPLYSTRVDDVILDFKNSEGPRVIGVVTETGEKIYADAVADCSGINSMIAKKSGLCPRHDKKKAQFAVKLIYKLDREVMWKRFGMWTGKDGRPCSPWFMVPCYFGSNPDFFAAHLVGNYPEGVMECTVYCNLDEMVACRHNVWNRILWFQDVNKNFLEGAELVRANFHALNCFDLVGVDTLKSYMPGLFLVGDAGSFANPVESWGANVAQWQGRMVAQLVAGMNADNDWSLARFAEYEAKWDHSWVGDDTKLVPLNFMFRSGGLDSVMKAIDSAAAQAVKDKIDDKPYSEIFPNAIAAAAPQIIPILPTPFNMTAQHALEKAAPLMKIAEQLKD